MDLATAIEFWAGLFAYSLASALYFLELVRAERSATSRFAPVALGAGAALHAAHVVSASLLTRICPVESLHFALSLSALIAVVGFLFVRRRQGFDALGAVVAPAALAFLVAAQFVHSARPAGDVPRALLALHVTANLLGVGLFVLAAVSGAFYLVVERRLKDKRAGSGKLPALDVLDRTLHRLLLAGFPLLTIGVISGAAFGPGHVAPSDVLRSVFAWTTWFVVAGVLTLRSTAGWRGRRAAWGALLGALCVMLVIVLYAVRPGAGGL